MNESKNSPSPSGYKTKPQPQANITKKAVHWCLQNRAALTDFAIRLLKFLIFLHNNGGA